MQTIFLLSNFLGYLSQKDILKKVLGYLYVKVFCNFMINSNVFLLFSSYYLFYYWKPTKHDYVFLNIPSDPTGCGPRHNSISWTCVSFCTWFFSVFQFVFLAQMCVQLWYYRIVDRHSATFCLSKSNYRLVILWIVGIFFSLFNMFSC